MVGGGLIGCWVGRVLGWWSGFECLIRLIMSWEGLGRMMSNILALWIGVLYIFDVLLC